MQLYFYRITVHVGLLKHSYDGNSELSFIVSPHDSGLTGKSQSQKISLL